jgi:hypothetical protein
MLFVISMPLLLIAEEEPRTWTDNKGNKIEAALLAADNEKISVRLNGKIVDIPLWRLSKEDQNYAMEWQEGVHSDDDEDEDQEGEDTAGGLNQLGDKPVVAAGTSTFDGKELITGGKVNLFEYEYDAESLEMLKKKFKAEDTGYRIAIAVPADFDPSKPQKVIVVMGATNNAKQAADGNTATVGFYAGWAVSKGWVCIGYDSNIGLAAIHDGANIRAVNKLKAAWPGITGWTIATGGNSGGAKGALREICLLKSMGLPARGVFMGGCNFAGNLTAGRDIYKLSKGDIRDIRFYSSYYEGPADADAIIGGVIGTIKGEGGVIIRDVRFKDSFEERKNQFQAALAWFEQATP